MTKTQFVVSMLGKWLYFPLKSIYQWAGLDLGQLIIDLTGPGLGWAWSTWARAGLGRELVSPWRTLPQSGPTHGRQRPVLQGRPDLHSSRLPGAADDDRATSATRSYRTLPGDGDETETRHSFPGRPPSRPSPPCLLLRPPLRRNGSYINRPPAARRQSAAATQTQNSHTTSTATYTTFYLSLCKLLAGRPALWVRRVSGVCPRACKLVVAMYIERTNLLDIHSCVREEIACGAVVWRVINHVAGCCVDCRVMVCM